MLYVNLALLFRGNGMRSCIGDLKPARGYQDGLKRREQLSLGWILCPKVKRERLDIKVLAAYASGYLAGVQDSYR